jgi:hypothetical protein
MLKFVWCCCVIATLLMAGCGSSHERELNLGDRSVSEALLVASFRPIVGTYPELCRGLESLTGVDAYNEYLLRATQAVSEISPGAPDASTPTALPPSDDVERAGQLLQNECETANQ